MAGVIGVGDAKAGLALNLQAVPRVPAVMLPLRNVLFVTSCLLAGGVAAAGLARTARGSDFTAFAEDEDICRKAGTAAIAKGSRPSAVARYDFTYKRCMAVRGWMRQSRISPEDGPQGNGGAPGNPHTFEFPDAFYAIPYATPGYGYDGFGY